MLLVLFIRLLVFRRIGEPLGELIYELLIVYMADSPLLYSGDISELRGIFIP